MLAVNLYIEVRKDIQTFTVAIEGLLNNPWMLLDPTTLGGQSIGLLTAFPWPKKTPAACLSGDCWPGNPKMKWFALERSPNVSHPEVSHRLAESRQDIFCDRLLPLSRTERIQLLRFLPESD